MDLAQREFLLDQMKKAIDRLDDGFDNPEQRRSYELLDNQQQAVYDIAGNLGMFHTDCLAIAHATEQLLAMLTESEEMDSRDRLRHAEDTIRRQASCIAQLRDIRTSLETDLDVMAQDLADVREKLDNVRDALNR